MKHDKQSAKIALDTKRNNARNKLLEQAERAYDNCIELLHLYEIDTLDDDELDAYSDLLDEY